MDIITPRLILFQQPTIGQPVHVQSVVSLIKEWSKMAKRSIHSFANYCLIFKKKKFSFDIQCFGYSKMIFIPNCFQNSGKWKYCNRTFLMTNKLYS